MQVSFCNARIYTQKIIFLLCITLYIRISILGNKRHLSSNIVYGFLYLLYGGEQRDSINTGSGGKDKNI